MAVFVVINLWGWTNSTYKWGWVWDLNPRYSGFRLSVKRSSLFTFVVTVGLIELRGEMTDVARRQQRCSVWEKAKQGTVCFLPDRMLLFLPSNDWYFALQRNQSTVTTNSTTKTIKRSTWIRCKTVWKQVFSLLCHPCSHKQQEGQHYM